MLQKVVWVGEDFLTKAHTQCSKIQKQQLQFKEAALFAPKSTFLIILFKYSDSGASSEMKKKFQKKLFLVVEVIVQPHVIPLPKWQ